MSYDQKTVFFSHKYDEEKRNSHCKIPRTYEFGKRNVKQNSSHIRHTIIILYAKQSENYLSRRNEIIIKEKMKQPLSNFQIARMPGIERHDTCYNVSLSCCCYFFFYIKYLFHRHNKNSF
jgi:hypothetical protein